MRKYITRHRITARALAAAMAIHVVAVCRLGNANPGDIFSVAAPAPTAEQPVATPIRDGDASVATKTGAFEYSYPINVPPGRNGMQPHLQLAYSSQAPIYGTVAAGWSLNVPIISQDTTDGRLRAATTYQSSMAGNRPLVPITETFGSNAVTEYRAQNDSSFTRYLHGNGTGYWWRALSPAGSDYRFGDPSHTDGTCILSWEYAPLTEEIDAFGNTVNYYYEGGVTHECRLASITWGENGNAGITNHVGRLVFNYSIPAQCGDEYVGAQTSYRTGSPLVTGASRLDSILATALDTSGAVVHTRTISLGYDYAAAQCGAAHSAYRALASITETAVGADPTSSVTLPPLTFHYGSADVNYDETETQLPWWPPDSPGSYNLGWGYRFTDTRWPTVEATMLDVDGDGLVDRLRSVPVLDDTKTHTVSCRAAWDRNRGDGTFDILAGYIDLPTVKWASTVITPPALYTSGPYAGANQATGVDESCSLNYQMSAFANASDGGAGFDCSFGQNPQACPCAPTDFACISAGNAYCSNTSNDCSPKHAKGPTILAYRWIDINGDGRVDLVASIAGGGLDVYNLQQGNGYNAGGGYQVPPAEPKIFGQFPGCAVHGVSAALGGGYTMCGNMYPWFVYLNHGGTFGQAPQPNLPTPVQNSPTPDYILYQPSPLETSSGDSSITSRPVGATQANLDLDGDTYADEVFGGGPSGYWGLYHADSRGELRGYFPGAPDPYFFYLNGSQPTSFINLYEVGGAGETSNLLDLNGDGLPDRWEGATASSSTVAFNDGVEFRADSKVSTRVRPSVETSSTIDNSCVDMPGGICATGHPPNQFIYVGYRIETQRPFDIDTDGRTDVSEPGQQATWFNQGGQFAPWTSAGAYPGDGLQHTIYVSDQALAPGFGGPIQPYTWQIMADMLDLDGDGVPEGFDFMGGRVNMQQLYLSKSHTAGVPRRLMVQVDNHRGAVTEISYARSTDPSVVTHDAAHTMPHPQWLVKSLITTDSLASTTSTSTYAYNNPQYSQDDRSHFGFRGFGQVTTTRPSGAQLVERFSFDPDWSGRLHTSIVLSSAADAAGPVTIDDTYVEACTLFGSALTTFLPTGHDHWTCPKNSGADAEAACRGNANNRRREVSKWTPLASSTTDGSSLLWAERESDEMSGLIPVNTGDRRTSTAFTLYADANNYRLHDISTTKSVLQNGTWQTFASSSRKWDSTYRVCTTDDVYSDSTHTLETRRQYDMTTGLLQKRWKPGAAQWGDAFTRYEYDANAIYVTKETNELGQSVSSSWDLGTGIRLSTTGPNVATCTPPACARGGLMAEWHAIKVDGLGRTVERDETYSDDGSAYFPYVVETTKYSDPDNVTVGGAHQPATIEHHTAIDGPVTNIRYTEDLTELDGHGRTRRKTVFVFGGAPANQVTTNTYGNDGTLVSVSLPDPSKNDASTVHYDYTYDSLGRPTSLRRPDSSVLSSRSGVDLAYDGLTTTTTEFVGAAGGSPASTRTTNDRYGRLVKVDELRAPGSWASTLYSYSADDNVQSIVDPEGVTTQLVHDWAGRRVAITRASGTWSYGYDADGNLASELPPCTDAGCASTYTTSTTYDALDRPSSKLIAPRDLAPADLDLFGSGLETFKYDQGPNGIGRLSSWAAYGPGASTPTNSAAYSYNAQGHRTNVTETVNLAGFSNVSRSYQQTFNLDGQVKDTFYRDGVGTTNCKDGSLSEALYDNRGLLSQVEIVPCPTINGTKWDPSPDYSYVQNARNVAGLVTRRAASAGVTAIAPAGADWVYDPLGREVSQTVTRTLSGTQVAKQAFRYSGNDDITQLVQSLGSTNQVFNYTYDPRHQIVSAASTTPGYFAGTYSYGQAGRFTAVNESSAGSPGTDLAPRNVTYEYAGRDPEQVTALRNVRGGKPFTSYTYDTAGNQIASCNGNGGGMDDCFGIEMQYVYDGNNDLRRATELSYGAVQGSEEYWYDSSGARQNIVKRSSSGEVPGEADSPNVLEMEWFLGPVEAHYDPSGSPTEIMSHVGMGTTAARLSRTAAASLSVEYQFHGLGDGTLATTDQATGATNVAFVYAPFGQLLEVQSGNGVGAGADAHRRRANDKFVDEISGLSYYGYRYLDRTSLTWTQADPFYRFAPDAALVNPRRAALYVDDLNNPLRYVDPDGRDGEDVLGSLPSIGAALGVAGTAITAGLSAALTSPVTVPLAVIGGLAVVAVNSHADMDDYVGTQRSDLDIPTDPSATYDADSANHIHAANSTQQDLNPSDRDVGSRQTQQDQPGGAPGSRPGKPFTNAGKKALDKANAEANGGVNKCTKCGREVVPGKKSEGKVTPPGNERQRDHIIPKSKGGSGTIENGDIKCRDCNIEKSDKIETSDDTNKKAD